MKEAAIKSNPCSIPTPANGMEACAANISAEAKSRKLASRALLATVCAVVGATAAVSVAIFSFYAVEAETVAAVSAVFTPAEIPDNIFAISVTAFIADITLSKA